MTWTYNEWGKRVEDITWERDADHDVLFDDWTEDRNHLIDVLIQVESWWVEQGCNLLDGAPACVFAVRGILDQHAKHDQKRITTNDYHRHA